MTDVTVTEPEVAERTIPAGDRSTPVRSRRRRALLAAGLLAALAGMAGAVGMAGQ